MFNQKKTTKEYTQKVIDKVNPVLNWEKSIQKIEEHDDYLILDGEYVKSYYVKQCKDTSVKMGFDAEIRLIGENIKTNVSFWCLSPLKAEQKLSSTIEGSSRTIDNNQTTVRKANKANAERENALEMLTEIQQGRMQLCDIEYIITIRAKSIEELNRLSSLIEQKASTIGLYLTAGVWEQKALLLASLGMRINMKRFKIDREYTMDILHAFLPNTGILNFNSKGLYLGVHTEYNTHISADILYGFGGEIKNRNIFIYGESGGGKTYTTKVIDDQFLLNKIQLIKVDPKPKPDYVDYTLIRGGKVYGVSDIKINIFETLQKLQKIGDDLTITENKLIVENLSDLIKHLTDIPSDEVFKAINAVYEAKEKIDFKSIEKYISEVYKIKLVKFTKGLGIFNGVFDSPVSNIDLSHPLICFNISNSNENLTKKIMIVLCDYLMKNVFKDDKPVQLVIEEAHMLSDTTIIGDMSAMARSANGGVTVISQKRTALDNMRDSKGIIVGRQNFAITLCFAENPQDLDEKNYKSWPDNYFKMLLKMQVGQYFLETTSGQLYPVKFPYFKNSKELEEKNKMERESKLDLKIKEFEEKEKLHSKKTQLLAKKQEIEEQLKELEQDN
jgi:hypothetical protein